jgi:hypothetical protein
MSKLRSDWMHTSALLSAMAAFGGRQINPESINPIPDPLRGEMKANALDFLEVLYGREPDQSSNNP